MEVPYDEKKHSNNSLRSLKKINLYLRIIFVCILLIIILIGVYIGSSVNKNLNITEIANVDYQVYLNENEYYEGEYIEENKQYVSSLIKKIVANFDYTLNANKDSFDYTYRIDAIINVIDTKTNNSLYEKTNTLVEEKALNSDGNNEVTINEELDIDYSYYNSIASNFISEYNLASRSESTLYVIMYIKAENMEETTVELSIPLTETTIAIDTKTKLASDSDQLIARNK